MENQVETDQINPGCTWKMALKTTCLCVFVTIP